MNAKAVAARLRWAKPGAREAHSVRIQEAWTRKHCWRAQASGKPAGRRLQVSIYLDEDMAAAVRAVAVREEQSFAEIVRRYVQWGLDIEGGEQWR